jgi:hypothetical protein
VKVMEFLERKVTGSSAFVTREVERMQACLVLVVVWFGSLPTEG